MTLSHVSTRFGALAGAALVSATLLFVAPQAHAAGNGPYYKVELAQPATAKQELIRSVFVKCDGATCRAPVAGSVFVMVWSSCCPGAAGLFGSCAIAVAPPR